MTHTIIGSNIFPQGIEEVSTIEEVSLGLVVQASENDVVNKFIYAKGATGIVKGTLVYIDESIFLANVPPASGGGIKAEAMGDIVSNSYGWFKILEVSSGNKIVANQSSVTLSNADSGKNIVVKAASGANITLPDATGSGNKFEITVGQNVVLGSINIGTNANSAQLLGGSMSSIDGNDNVNFYNASSASSVDLNGTTKGGRAGDRFIFVDIDTNKYSVHGVCNTTGTPVTPFS